MDRVAGSPRHEAGYVWLKVRVDGYRIEVGAARSGEWRIFHMPAKSPDYDKATALAEAYERDHATEFATLFAEAEAWRKAHP